MQQQYGCPDVDALDTITIGHCHHVSAGAGSRFECKSLWGGGVLCDTSSALCGSSSSSSNIDFVLQPMCWSQSAPATEPQTPSTVCGGSRRPPPPPNPYANLHPPHIPPPHTHPFTALFLCLVSFAAELYYQPIGATKGLLHSVGVAQTFVNTSRSWMLSQMVCS
jgi:hypothetical protein